MTLNGDVYGLSTLTTSNILLLSTLNVAVLIPDFESPLES